MSYVSEVLADSPRGYWRMNDASGNIQDSSGNGMHATSTSGDGSATYDQPGAIASDSASRSILFNPDFRFNIPDDPDLDLGDVFTLEWWFDFDGTPGLWYVMSKNTNGYEMRINASRNFSLHKSNISDTVESTSPIPDDGEFHHCVATKNGATSKLYLDGVDVTGSVSNSTYANTTDPLTIGSDPGDGIDGFLAEVAVYSTALSQARVQAHFDAASASTATLAWIRA